MAEPNRRGTVTAEHKDEAARLRKLWELTERDREERGVGTQAAFGHEFDIGNQSAVGFFLGGHTALSLKAARGFALGLRVTIDQFSHRLALQAAELGRLAGIGPPALQAQDSSAPPYLATDTSHEAQAVETAIRRIKTSSPRRRKTAATPIKMARRNLAAKKRETR